MRLKRYLLQLALESVSAGTLLHVWRGARLLTCSRAMKRGGSRANIAKLPVLVRTAGLELSKLVGRNNFVDRTPFLRRLRIEFLAGQDEVAAAYGADGFLPQQMDAITGRHA